MTLHSIPSDTIAFHSISTGGNSAGNGGDGVNVGNITNNAHIDFKPANNASGGDVHVNTGDDVHQHSNGWLASGDQHNYSGHDTSTVAVDTTAYQTNFLAADMSTNVLAGIGGNGGDGNYAVGGDVHVHA